MTALLPSVSTTESSAVNSTTAVASGWIADLLDLADLDAGDADEVAVSSPVTLVNSAL